MKSGINLILLYSILILSTPVFSESEPDQIDSDRIILAEWKGKAYLARILSEKDGKYLISYPFYHKDWDEWVEKDRLIIPLKTGMVLREGRWYFAGLLNKNKKEYSILMIKGRINEIIKVPAQDFVEVIGLARVEWEGSWYRAGILKEEERKFYIRYDEYESKWDEWVSLSRIKME
ncbi:MAG: hypothetical protein KKH98_13185 [Spirochaetes bacterium]|nr:hypothetical protein [Spirochaetota bacterium]